MQTIARLSCAGERPLLGSSTSWNVLGLAAPRRPGVDGSAERCEKGARRSTAQSGLKKDSKRTK
jgi:hypothetical protein